MPFKLILNKDSEELIHEYDSWEEAFDAAEPRILEGYVARFADNEGTIKYTQTRQSDDVIATFPGDATQQTTNESQAYGFSPKPWWKFW